MTNLYPALALGAMSASYAQTMPGAAGIGSADRAPHHARKSRQSDR